MYVLRQKKSSVTVESKSKGAVSFVEDRRSSAPRATSRNCSSTKNILPSECLKMVDTMAESCSAKCISYIAETFGASTATYSIETKYNLKINLTTFP